jgi:hypothetical protein
VQRFYMARSYAAAWTADEKQSAAALRVLRRASEHGLPPARYVSGDLPGLLAPEGKSIADALDRDPGRLAQLDVRVTTALLTLGRDVAIGRTRSRVDRPALESAAHRARPGRVAGAVDVDVARRLARRRTAGASRVRGVAEGAGDPAAAGRSEAMDDEAARRIALNLERWRWMPDDLGERHILVNVPAFYMAVREHGKPVLDMKVIVGKQDRATPLFSAVMKEVVFSPYWNVPDSIAEGETAPAAARDPKFLTRNNIEILRRGGSRDDVSRCRRCELERSRCHQGAGVSAEAGRRERARAREVPVSQFLRRLPARHARRLALRAAGRALSHGCVRLDQPDALARYVLRDNPEWDEAKIQAAMHQEEERHVALKAPCQCSLCISRRGHVPTAGWTPGRTSTATTPEQAAKLTDEVGRP